MTATTSAAREARAFTDTPLFQGLARAGLVARGVVYVLIGVLAIRVARGFGGDRPSQEGALRTIAHEPLGHVLVLLTAIGLAGFALWRLAEALVGHTPEYGEHSTAERIGSAGSFVAYAAFAALAISLLRGSSGSSSSTTHATTAGVLHWPAGREIVAAAGLAFIAVGVFEAYVAVTRRFLEHARTAEMPPAVLRAYTAIGLAGLVSRGVAFALIGLFALRAAWDYDARDAVGLDGALTRLTHHAYGTTALVLVAIGLLAFGAYSLADARYRRI
jgi:hypothetical protein